MGAKLLSDGELLFLATLWPIYTRARMLEVFNETYGRRLRFEQLKGIAGRYRFGPSANDGRFRKGQVPANKGRLGYCAPGSEKGWFRKGNDGYRTVPVFSEAMRRDKRGRMNLFIKIPEPSPCQSHKRTGWHQKGHWIRKAVWVWSQANGPVPKGHAVVLLDGDPANCELSNLDCVPRGVLQALNAPWAPGYAGKAVNPARVRLAQARTVLRKRRKGRSS